MTTMIKSLYLAVEEWGPNKERLTGKLKLVNDYGKIELNIPQDRVRDNVSLIADAVVVAVKDVSKLMTADVVDQVRAPDLRG